MNKIATAVELSSNAKIGQGVSATYAAQGSCPDTCPFLHNGCYAELGNSFAGFTTNRLNIASRARKSSHMAIARAEAAALNKLSGTRPVRLHVVGDCKSVESAKIVSTAARRFPIAWTYTHAWRTVRRSAWGSVSVLASCETLEQAKSAMKRGYAALVVMESHPTDKAYMKDGVKVIPCPENTRGIPCSSCKLCWKADYLHSSNSVIAVAAHGSRKKNVVESLVSIELASKNS